jgi:NhaP-type Na+/H+ or K+/H+ antiporter
VGRLAIRTLLIGPGAGVGVGLAAIAALDLVRRRVGVRRDYESLYSLGVAFLAYAAGEAVHGSGFLAAFTAGLTIVALDVELCDCFLEYGETTAEMTLLFTFVLLGSSLIWRGLEVLDGRTLAFVALALLARPAAFLPSLVGTSLSARDRWLIAWLGPRGLSSLLLVLLPVFAGIAGSERLFATCCLVVLVSIVIHGGALVVLGRRAAARMAREEHAPAATTPPLSASEPASERVTIDELAAIEASGAPQVVLDARTDRSISASGLDAVGALRIPPDDAVARVRQLDLPADAWLVVFCA